MIDNILKQNNINFSNIFPFELSLDTVLLLDLSKENKELYNLDLSSTSELSNYIQEKLKQANKNTAVGGYSEDRLIYSKSKHFGDEEAARTIHLGTDIWCRQNTSLFAPLDSRIHSFQNNDNFGDYGPTIILEHQLDNVVFYTLYGHLSKESLVNKQNGQVIKKGELFAEIGNEFENGHWPPHLHFQIISDMMGNSGDFPGVSNQKDKSQFLKLCPNPNLILNIQ